MGKTDQRQDGHRDRWAEGGSQEAAEEGWLWRGHSPVNPEGGAVPAGLERRELPPGCQFRESINWP